MEIDNKKISKWITDKKEFHLLDVRRDDEREICNLGGFHIPLHELETRFNELPHDKLPMIVYCHHGVRSLYATQFLKFHGYDALSLRGGIDAWSIEIDPNVPRY
ncbi:rhodanese-like domain-containing protein [Peredibacter sp. HCB2-198]|uniref:rhodanese-like domain-containing protein n=1 Tax=Peredibacter sp. HCB2-198 TaxID=3383025 RepID=UPI0038B5DE32